MASLLKLMEPFLACKRAKSLIRSSDIGLERQFRFASGDNGFVFRAHRLGDGENEPLGTKREFPHISCRDKFQSYRLKLGA